MVPSRRIEAIDVGDGVEVAIHHVVGASPGPTLCLFGGVHGDELEGIAAARLLLAELDPAELRGELRVVPIANPPAFAARTRSSPLDGGNLARVFPGAPDGTPTVRIAHALTERAIAGADFLIDLHSAGTDYVMPWFVGYVSLPGAAAGAAEAAELFGAPWIWEHDSINPGRSLTAALDLGVPALYVEGAGGDALLRDEVLGDVRGVRWVMALLGMLPDEPQPTGTPPTVLRGGAGDVDVSMSCTRGGWCATAVRVGDAVRAGELVAEILDERGASERIEAPVDGTVMLLRRRAEVVAGDGIAMLGPPAA